MYPRFRRALSASIVTKTVSFINVIDSNPSNPQMSLTSSAVFQFITFGKIVEFEDSRKSNICCLGIEYISPFGYCGS